MKISISQRPVEPDDVVAYEWKFGKTKGFDETFPYSLEAEIEEFLPRFEPIYNACVDELKRDDGIIGNFTPPYPGAKDYPAIKELVQLPPDQLLEFVQDHFSFDIVNLFIPEPSGSTGASWILLKIDEIAMNQKSITIKGLACRNPIVKA